jgi:ribosome maturation factor RimP
VIPPSGRFLTIIVMDTAFLAQLGELVRVPLILYTAELVEMIYRREGGVMVLRLLVDKRGGITLNECAALNAEISRTLEAANLIQEPYTIEVSSPGLDRPLRAPRDFERAVGETVALHLVAQPGGRPEVTGEIVRVAEGLVHLHAADGTLRSVPLDDIAFGQRQVTFR